MPDAGGAFKGISVPADAWSRIFGSACPAEEAQRIAAENAGRRAVRKHREALRLLAAPDVEEHTSSSVNVNSPFGI